MAKKLGNDRKVYIQTATAGTYQEIAGQRGYKRGGDAQEIDIGAKNDAPYGATAPGAIKVTIDVEGVVDLPDANGLERVYTMWKTRTAELYECRKSPFGTGDVVWRGSFFVTKFPTDDDMNAESKYQFTLANNGALTTDTLG